jgi:DNA replication and repair protein RecF
MKIRHLQAIEFRNFSNLQLELRPGINFFLGENGQGKTNLLEAVYLLCRGNSFRAADSKSLLRHPYLTEKIAPRAKISGEFVKKSLDFSVQLTLESGKKTAVVNGKKANSAALMSHFPVVLFSPESLSAIKEGPDQRRQLIDEILLSHDPRQGRLLREFVRALKTRNRLLKYINQAQYEKFNRSASSRVEHERSLESLNKIYLILSTHLSVARTKALRDIQSGVSDAMQFITHDSPESDTAAGTNGARVEISVDYVISGQSALDWDESKVYDALLQRQSELAAQEVAAGSSLVGPHKHDIKLLFNGNDSRFYCSQGQQRALILALKMAQIVYHHRVHQTYPVLLLDDVLSELDLKKRVNLMKFLEGISAQILITATDLTWSKQIGFDSNSIFSVSNGHVGGFDVSSGIYPDAF